MSDALETFAGTITSRLKRIGLRPPSKAHLLSVLRVVHSASLRVEEGRPIRCSVSFADPSHPRYLIFASTRADVPNFSKLGKRHPLTIDNFVKLGRAMDPWATSLAAYVGADGKPYLWGFVDQRIQFNTWMFAETIGRPIQKDAEGQQPGLVTIEIDGIAQLSAYHETAFLGSLRYDTVIADQANALSAQPVLAKIRPTMRMFANQIWSNLPPSARSEEQLETELLQRWQASVRRICSGIQRSQTGGALIITPEPDWEKLHGHETCYERIAEALTCSVLEDEYFHCVQSNITPGADVLWSTYEKYVQASEDTRDRQEELTSAIRAVGGLARLDGAVVLRPDLTVNAFGVKINTDTEVSTVYHGSTERGKKGRQFDTSHLGTRNLSAIRYCRDDPNAIAIVVSQDGPVRVVTMDRRRILIWDDIRVRNTDPRVGELRELYNNVVGFESLPEKRGFTEVPKNSKALAKGQYRGNLQ